MEHNNLTINEAAEFLGVSRSRLYRLSRRGQVPCFKRRAQTSPWCYPRGALHNWFIRDWHQRIRAKTTKRLRTLRALGPTLTTNRGGGVKVSGAGLLPEGSKT